MAVERVVVESNFRIKRHEAAIAGYDAWINFHKRRIRFNERAIERLKKRHGHVYNFGRESEPEGEFARLKREQSSGRINRLAQNRIGIILRHFLDPNSTDWPGLKPGRAHCAIYENAQV